MQISKADCLSEALCDEKQGQCDVCVPGTYSCANDESFRCDTAGQANEKQQTCGNGRCYANGMSGGCYLCDVNEYRCSGNELQKCAAGRLSFELEQDCGADSTCFVDATTHECQPSGTGGAAN